MSNKWRNIEIEQVKFFLFSKGKTIPKGEYPLGKSFERKTKTIPEEGK